MYLDINMSGLHRTMQIMVDAAKDIRRMNETVSQAFAGVAETINSVPIDTATIRQIRLHHQWAENYLKSVDVASYNFGAIIPNFSQRRVSSELIPTAQKLLEEYDENDKSYLLDTCVHCVPFSELSEQAGMESSSGLDKPSVSENSAVSPYGVSSDMLRFLQGCVTDSQLDEIVDLRVDVYYGVYEADFDHRSYQILQEWCEPLPEHSRLEADRRFYLAIDEIEEDETDKDSDHFYYTIDKDGRLLNITRETRIEG